LTTQELGGISKRLTREQSLRVFVTANSIDKIVELSREYDSQILIDKHEIIEDILEYGKIKITNNNQ
jgi:hypothetical protein